MNETRKKISSIKEFFINILTSGMYFEFDIRIVRKVILTNLISMVGFICLVFYGIHAYIHESYILCFIDLLTAFFLVIVFFYLRKTKKYIFSAYFSIILVGLLFMYLSLSGGYQGTGLLWSYIFPLCVIFVLGIKAGTIAVIIFFLLNIAAFILSLNSIIPIRYNTNFIIRYIGSFLAVSIIAYFYEFVRLRIQEVLSERNQKLRELSQKLEDANKKLNAMATTDKLTGIANHRKFMEFISREWEIARRNNKPLSLLIADIDYFKKFNDTYGHLEGDKCLKKIGETLKKSTKRPGDIVARYGGEEFTVLLPDTDSKGALDVAKRMKKNIISLKIPHKKSDIAKYVTISFGVSTYISEKSGNSYRILIEKADKALYRSKERGRNKITFLKT